MSNSLKNSLKKHRRKILLAALVLLVILAVGLAQPVWNCHGGLTGENHCHSFFFPEHIH